MHLLIVEDEVRMADLLRKGLTEEGTRPRARVTPLKGSLSRGAEPVTNHTGSPDYG